MCGWFGLLTSSATFDIFFDKVINFFPKVHLLDQGFGAVDPRVACTLMVMISFENLPPLNKQAGEWGSGVMGFYFHCLGKV